MADRPEEPAAAAGGDRYAAVAIALHWLIAVMILVQIILAGRMEGPRTPASFAITQLHKSIGITVLLLSLVRLGWRLANPPPPLPPTMARWERWLAHATHIGLYLVMIGMPLTGWIMVSASRTSIPTLLYGAIPWPNLPLLPELAPASKRLWHAIGEQGHGIIIKFGYGLIGLHVAGALKHQLFSHDEPVLARMAPGARAGRWLEPRLLLIALAAVASAAFAKLVQPPLPRSAPPAAVTPQGPAQEPVEAQAPGEPASHDATPAAPAAASASGAKPAPAPAPAAAPTGPVSWRVLPGSRLTFATAWSGTPISGRFERWTAQILFSPDALDRSRIRVSVDMGSADTGDAQRDATLPSGDWFDAAAHPQAVFAASRFTQAGEGRFIAHGTLSLRGVTRPFDLPFRLKIDGDRAEAQATGAIDRTVFGVGQGDFSATDQIPGKVTIRVDLKARRAP